MDAVSILVDKIVVEIVNPAIALIFVAGLVVFFWGLVEFLWNRADSDKQEHGKRHMLWGVVGVFIMLSAYGILALFTNAFGIPF